MFVFLYNNLNELNSKNLSKSGQDWKFKIIFRVILQFTKNHISKKELMCGF